MSTKRIYIKPVEYQLRIGVFARGERDARWLERFGTEENETAATARDLQRALSELDNRLWTIKRIVRYNPVYEYVDRPSFASVFNR